MGLADSHSNDTKQSKY